MLVAPIGVVLLQVLDKLETLLPDILPRRLLLQRVVDLVSHLGNFIRNHPSSRFFVSDRQVEILL